MLRSWSYSRTYLHHEVSQTTIPSFIKHPFISLGIAQGHARTLRITEQFESQPWSEEHRFTALFRDRPDAEHSARSDHEYFKSNWQVIRNYSCL